MNVIVKLLISIDINNPYHINYFKIIGHFKHINLSFILFKNIMFWAYFSLLYTVYITSLYPNCTYSTKVAAEIFETKQFSFLRFAMIHVFAHTWLIYLDKHETFTVYISRWSRLEKVNLWKRRHATCTKSHTNNRNAICCVN